MPPTDPPPEAPAEAEPPASARKRRGRLRRPLPVWKRLLLLMAGWLLVLVGVAGLVLPGIQGIATLFAGAAILSLVSEIAYDVLRWSFKRWPWGWRKVSKLRRRIQRWLHPDEPE